MPKSAYLIHVLVAFYLLAGSAMILTPQWVVAAKSQLLSRVKDSRPATPETHRDQLRQTRISGLVQLGIMLVLVFGMNLSYGLRPTGDRDSAVLGPSASELQRRVAEHLQPQVTRGRYPSLVAAGIVGEEHFFVGLGSIDPRSLTPPTADTLYEIGSVSKVFTGLLLARGVESGNLSLNQEVGTILPRAAMAQPLAPGIQLGSLVTHTSGLSRSPPCAGWAKRAWAGFRGGNPYSACDTKTLIAGLPAAGCSARSGQGAAADTPIACSFEYSNYGFALLGLALATHAGTDFDSLVREQIGGPLGMSSTGTRLSPAERARLIPGHANHIGLGPFYGAQRAAPWTFPDAFAGAGGLRSSAADMLRFLKAASGRAPADLLPAIQRSQTVLYRESKDDHAGQDNATDTETIAVGMAWFEKRLPGSEDLMLFHNGLTGGHAAYIGLLRDQPVGVAILANASSDLTDVGEALLSLLHARADTILRKK